MCFEPPVGGGGGGGVRKDVTLVTKGVFKHSPSDQQGLVCSTFKSLRLLEMLETPRVRISRDNKNDSEIGFRGSTPTMTIHRADDTTFGDGGLSEQT